MRNGARATRRQDTTTSRPAGRNGPATLTALAATILLALCALFGAAGPGAAADGDGLIKVYVVKSPAQNGGTTDTLGSVAASTLGDPGRSNDIFTLNRGLVQPDGGALNNPADPLVPGWILRLPDDASGPDVQLAKEAGNQDTTAPGTGSGQARNGTGQTQNATGGTATTDSGALVFPLAAVLAVAGAFLLALVTAGIVGRRRVARAARALAGWFCALGEPGRRRRRRRQRRALAGRFASDTESVRRAYGVLAEFGGSGGREGTAVHAVRVDRAGVTAWLAVPDTAADPWKKLDGTRWRRAGTWPGGGPGESAAARSADPSACLVRVGTDDEGEPVFVDLSRLDGILSVTGDRAVSHDVVRGLLDEIARTRPDVPVTQLAGADGGTPFAVPPELTTRPAGGAVRAVSPREGRAATGRGTVRAGAVRRPLKGLVVVSGAPAGREAAELLDLCGPGGAGWTALVCGEVGGAHWRWHAAAEGTVEIPVLGVRLTVPA
ncbi:hypothetical protein [Streptomyces liangshanensis]|uniref:hypothetical protein n=1 Tax=Streptomyces liangshanensis TaxID=2717324 RepID=UPI0036DC8EB8